MDKEQVDLIDDYHQFLENKSLLEHHEMEVDQEAKQKSTAQKDTSKNQIPQYPEFDYLDEKMQILEKLEAWQENEELCQQSIDLLGRFKSETSAASASLCEQLRIVLEP